MKKLLVLFLSVAVITTLPVAAFAGGEKADPRAPMSDEAKAHFDKCIGHLQRATQIKNKSERMKVCEQAVDEIDKALKLSPDNAKIVNVYGNLLYEMGKYSETVKVMEPFVKKYPDEFTAIIETLAYAYGKLKKYKKSEKYLLKVRKIDPAHTNSLYGLVALYDSWGKPKKLVKYAKMILKQNATAEKVRFKLAKAYFSMKKYEKAAEELEKVLETKPMFKTGLILICDAYYHTKEYDKAIHHAETFLKNFPRDKFAPKMKKNLKAYRALKEKAEKKK